MAECPGRRDRVRPRVSEDKQINARTGAVEADLPQGLVSRNPRCQSSFAPVHRTWVSK